MFTGADRNTYKCSGFAGFLYTEGGRYDLAGNSRAYLIESGCITFDRGVSRSTTRGCSPGQTVNHTRSGPPGGCPSNHGGK